MNAPAASCKCASDSVESPVEPAWHGSRPERRCCGAFLNAQCSTLCGLCSLHGGVMVDFATLPRQRLERAVEQCNKLTGIWRKNTKICTSLYQCEQA